MSTSTVLVHTLNSTIVSSHMTGVDNLMSIVGFIVSAASLTVSIWILILLMKVLKKYLKNSK